MRHEVKYLVPQELASPLRRVIGRHTVRDPHAGASGDYTVRSIYLDTPRGAMYRNKVEGHAQRLKVRVRAYGDVDEDARVRLELKRKRGALSWKRRSHLSLNRTIEWLGGRVDGSAVPAGEEADARTFLYFVRRHSLRPVVLVAYEREAFEGLHDPTLRITFDSNLRGLPTEGLEQLGAPAPVRVYHRDFILEVKYDYHFPGWLKPVLARYGLQRAALSKYVLTLDACARGTHGRRVSFSGGRIVRRSVFQQPF